MGTYPKKVGTVIVTEDQANQDTIETNRIMQEVEKVILDMREIVETAGITETETILAIATEIKMDVHQIDKVGNVKMDVLDKDVEEVAVRGKVNKHDHKGKKEDQDVNKIQIARKIQRNKQETRDKEIKIGMITEGIDALLAINILLIIFHMKNLLSRQINHKI